GIHRAAREARGLCAVVAAHREKGPRGIREPAAFDLADAAPVDRSGIAVLFVAGDDAALAADALPHVEVEAVLLAGLRRAIGDARGVDGACAREGQTATASTRQREGDVIICGSLQ